MEWLFLLYLQSGHEQFAITERVETKEECVRIAKFYKESASDTVSTLCLEVKKHNTPTKPRS